MGERVASNLAEELRTLDAAHVMATYARQPAAFVRGEGATLYDADGEPLSRLPFGNLGLQHRALPPACGRGAARTGGAAAARLQPLSDGACPEAGRAARVQLRRGRQGLLRKLGCRGERGRDQARPQAPPWRRDRRARRRFPRKDDGRARGDPQETKQEPFAPLVPGFVVVPRDDVGALRSAVSDRTAAVMIEPVQGETGVWPIADEMLSAAREVCDSSGALLVFDEIQCGMGRTGTLWAFEQTPVEPDVFTSAKSLASGLPIGACIARGDAAQVLVAGTTAPLSGAGRSRPRRRSRRSTSSTTSHCSRTSAVSATACARGSIRSVVLASWPRCVGGA